MSAPAVLVEPSAHGGWTVPACPFCGKPHDHGAAALGARLSHCRDVRVRQQYVLERPAPRRRSTPEKEQ